MEKQIKSPKLRFPEFTDEWEKKPLIQLSENGFSNGAFNDPRKVGSGYRIINVKDMYVDGTINIHHLTRVAIDEKEFSKNRVEFGDIFFTRSSLVKEGIAHSNVNLSNADDLTFDGHLIRMRPKKEICSPIFLYYNFATPNARIQFIQRGKTTTMTTIGQEDIATVEIILPTLSEQKRIASFFTVLDKKIFELKQKKDLLEQYKKGVMQKLFSQEMRFKDENGKEFPKWENKKLGDVLYEHKIKSSGKEEVFSVSVHKGLINQIEHLGRSFSASNTDNYNLVQPNDIVYTKSPTGDFPLGIIKQSKVGKNVIVSPLYGVFTPQSKGLGYLLNVYFESPLNTSNYLGSLIQKGAKNTINITNSTFLSKNIKLPISINEQNKIGDFLFAIDEKINRTENQIQQTQQYKKGLLQKMFV
jgi:type I restriction enzyme S subunit